MKNTRGIIILFFLFLFIATIICFGEEINKTIQVTYRNISIYVNNKQIIPEQEPFIYQGRTFVPLRTIGESLNKEVNWDNNKSQITINDIKKTDGLYLNIPVYKIGDRVAYEDFAITVNKRSNRDYDYDYFKKNGILILNCTIEYLGNKKPNAFVVYDDLAVYDQEGNRYIGYKTSKEMTFLNQDEKRNCDFYFPIENSNIKKGLILFFNPLFNRNIFITVSLDN